MRDYELFAKKTREFLGERVCENYLQRSAYKTDVSCYRYIPKIIIKARSEEENIKLYAFSNIHDIPITFRAADNSLSRQASRDSALILVIYEIGLSHKSGFAWQNITYLADQYNHHAKI